MKPEQLSVWHSYLDHMEQHGSAEETIKLYERCIIPCVCIIFMDVFNENYRVTIQDFGLDMQCLLNMM